eukprot:scpid105052/ scgid12097/ 
MSLTKDRRKFHLRNLVTLTSDPPILLLDSRRCCWRLHFTFPLPPPRLLVSQPLAHTAQTVHVLCSDVRNWTPGRMMHKPFFHQLGSFPMFLLNVLVGVHKQDSYHDSVDISYSQ